MREVTLERVIILLAVLCAGGVLPCAGDVLYVDGDAPGAGDGTSWADAYNYLQDALAVAQSGDIIRVAEGIYTPDADNANPYGTGDRDVRFRLETGMTLEGGYAGYGRPDPNAHNVRIYETTLSGDLNNDDGPNFLNNSENSRSVVICEGTVFLDGFVISSGNEGSGAGVRTAINCQLTMTNCILRANSSMYGGGMYNNSPGNIIVANCMFAGNRATAQGGAIYDGEANLTLIGCTFSNNSGGGLYGGRWYSNVTITNCILWSNGGATQSAQIGDQQFTINYSCIQGWTGEYGGLGNIGDDPLFVDTDGPDDISGTDDDNFHLLTGSPCLDSGDNSAIPPTVDTDLDGNLRIFNGTVDMGAYEGTDTIQPIIRISPSTLHFSVDEGYGNPPQQTLGVRNAGTGILNWQITEDCNWLQVEPNSGSSTGEQDMVIVTVDVNGLSGGFYDCNLSITAPDVENSPTFINVTLDVNGIWSNQIALFATPLASEVIFESDSSWVKFHIKLDDPCTVYFQNSKLYPFHYHFATEWLEPFIGMSVPEYWDVTLYEPNQLAVLGAVLIPPLEGEPPVPTFQEYGIQFIGYDLYSKEQIRDMFNVVKASVIADLCVQAFYFPTYEQLQVAEANEAWFASEGIPIGSIAQWFEGNIGYSEGWAIGELKYFPASEIQAAYLSGNLTGNDILLTDGIPAEIPYVAGIISLSPSTPNSHVAILARTYGIPFVYLADDSMVDTAWELVGGLALLCVQEVSGVYDVRLSNPEDNFTPSEIEDLLALKIPMPLDISPMAVYDDYSADTNGLSPNDINYFGGKAANYGILRTSIPNDSPVAVAFSFDVWNEFLEQVLTPRDSVVIEAGGYLLFWADNQSSQGPGHAGFKLSEGGEDIGLFDTGTSLIDGLSYGAQTTDVSYGRTPDGNDSWTLFYGGDISPNAPNPGGGGGPAEGLFINEFMADNDNIVADEYGEYDDWLEIYNAGPTAVDLGGMYLTDDLSDPTNWMIPVAITGNTLREEISNRLGSYTYPPSDLAALSADLAAIRNIITNGSITSFSPALEDAVIAVLQDPKYGFDQYSKIRFRSSTNVEDSEQFTGAGLYDSYSGCLADELDGDDAGPCACDPDKSNERGVFRAIRKVFASFYNDNAFLERLRHDVNEAEVGMALLVHHSFPDEFELANGVATMRRQQSASHWDIELVTQEGATSVSNPEDGSVPEEVSVYAESGGTVSMTLIRQSNLVILGETVMEWEEDYNDLTQLLIAAAEEYEAVTGKTEYILDFEYKKVAAGGAAIPAGGLVVKQIREIPQLDAASSTCPSAPSCTCNAPGDNILAERTYQGPNGVSIETSYCLNCPLGFICKTYNLSSWCRTVIRGYTTKSVFLFSNLSQSYLAGHHNWCEDFLFTPHLEPGVDQCSLNQLRAQDIRVIHLGGMTYCGTPYVETFGFGAGPFYLGDFEPDGDVDMADFAVFSQRWLDSDCGLCGGVDLDCDEEVGLGDLHVFADNWLAGR